MTTDRPLLDWLLQKYPDTPKTRAKQWIAAGRVSVNGVTIRQANQLLPDPQDKLELHDRQPRHSIAAGTAGGFTPA